MTRTGTTPEPASALTDSKAVEAKLLRRYHATRDEQAKEELVGRLMPLARSLAMRYRGGSEDLDDLVQVAALGLVKAINGFDPQKGRPFAGYAVPTILGELRRHFRDHVASLHLPRELQERTLAVRDAIEVLTDRTGRSPTVREVAEKLELSDEDVLEAMQASEARKTLSLDAPTASDDETSVPMIEAVGGDESGFAAIESQLAAEDAPLDRRELLVLRLRFGGDMTQAEIGRRLGVSQMQISRIMRRGLAKLLEAVQDDTTQEDAEGSEKVAALAA